MKASSEKISAEEYLKKAKLPATQAAKYHPFYRGKVAIESKVPIRTGADFAVWYTPGVAEPCRIINKDPDKVFDYTNKGNFVAVVSDGTRVLGLGDIGPLAAMPVMEGKALLFKYLGGVDAFPICMSTKDPDELITVVKWISPTFGAINLEDIAAPKCFHVLSKLKEELDIPVWHDDQQGTALVMLAGLINALKVVGKKIDEVKIGTVGFGAANTNNYMYLKVTGAKPKNILIADVNGMITPERAEEKWFREIEKAYGFNPCKETNPDGITCKTPEEAIPKVLKDADVCIAYSKSGPGTIKKEWIASMADDAVVFSCANPIPEIWPWEAEEAGAKIVLTGRSDFPNQANNSLGFPAVMRGVFDVGAKKVTDEMCLAGAYAIAEFAEEKGINEKYIIPTMDEEEMYVREAVAIGMKAIEQGVAKKKLSRGELEKTVTLTIKGAKEITKLLMDEKKIPPPPE